MFGERLFFSFFIETENRVDFRFPFVFPLDDLLVQNVFHEGLHFRNLNFFLTLNFRVLDHK